jgi:single-stranded DNA-binding protein
MPDHFDTLETRDPELRVTPDGLAICKMGLACNRVFYTKDGTKKEEVLFAPSSPE